MKMTMAGMAVLAAVLMCSAVTITYRDGHALVCDVLAKDDTNLIVRTVKGVQTNSWRQLAPASIKAVHPALFARLMQQALARKQQQADEMKAKGMILVGGKWISKKEDDAKALARVCVNVVTTEKVGVFKQKQAQDDTGTRQYSRQSCGLVKITLDSLDAARTYVLRVQYACCAVYDAKQRQQSKEIVKEETISRQRGATYEFCSEPYNEYKITTRGGISVSGEDGKNRRNIIHDVKVENWQVKLWLDDTLVYETTRDGQEHYYLVTKQ